MLTEGLNRKNLPHDRAISYLVNEIAAVNAQNAESSTVATYSIAVGLDNYEKLSGNPRGDATWDMRPASCVVNSWLAERLNIKPGSTIRIKFYQPETIEGREIETTQDLVVTGIVPVTAPAKGYVRNRAAVFKDAPTKPMIPT